MFKVYKYKVANQLYYSLFIFNICFAGIYLKIDINFSLKDIIILLFSYFMMLILVRNRKQYC